MYNTAEWKNGFILGLINQSPIIIEKEAQAAEGIVFKYNPEVKLSYELTDNAWQEAENIATYRPEDNLEYLLNIDKWQDSDNIGDYSPQLRLSNPTYRIY